MNAANFQIKHGGQPKHFYAERMTGELLATVSPHTAQSGAISKRFLNVCFIDGKTEIADGMEHASDLIAAKYFKKAEVTA